MKKDPNTINLLGDHYFHGLYGLQKDLRKGAELWTEATELGSVKALFSLGVAYGNGEGVEQDEAKSIHYYKEAAMQGHVESRHYLGNYEGKNGNHDNAVRHFLISAKMGYIDSIETIKRMFMAGIATKEQYAQALKLYQEAVEEMKSHDRDEVKRLGYLPTRESWPKRGEESS